MKIAQISPLWETVPPVTYGGTELVVALLMEGLANRGHQVTLYTCCGTPVSNHPNIEVKFFADMPLRRKRLEHPDLPAHLWENQMMSDLIENADRYDLIHNHLGFQLVPFSNILKTPMVTTLHGAFSSMETEYLTQYHAHQPFISISDYQRKACPDLNYIATVYHGLAIDKIKPSLENRKRNYLAFLGRLSPEKGPDHAIKAARETGYKLIMAGKVDVNDRQYFVEEIVPELDDQISYIGEVNFEQKFELLRNAAATLCPVTWPEPFGLVLTESMAAGTPVLALRNGSIPEIIAHGKTGFIADSPDELIRYVKRIDDISRTACREHVENRFSSDRMTTDYIRIFEHVLKSRSKVKPIEHLNPLNPLNAKIKSYPAGRLVESTPVEPGKAVASPIQQ